MSISSTLPAESYTPTAKTFHWITALFVFLVIPMGLVMADAEPGPLKNALFDLHRSLGITISALTILRLIYRLGHKPPPLDDSVQPIQRLAAHAVHILLYAGLIFLPIGGLLGAWMFGASLNYFWLFQIAPPMAADQETAKQILATHGLLSKIFAGLVILHIAAALAHHYVFKDRTLRRMLPH
jgi:cytochrome b561